MATADELLIIVSDSLFNTMLAAPITSSVCRPVSFDSEIRH